MFNLEEQLNWYALGRKGHNHTKINKSKKIFLKENKNITAVQNFLSDYWNKKRLKESQYEGI